MSMQWTQHCVYLHTTQQQQRQLLTDIINYDMLPNLVKCDTTILKHPTSRIYVYIFILMILHSIIMFTT